MVQLHLMTELTRQGDTLSTRACHGCDLCRDHCLCRFGRSTLRRWCCFGAAPDRWPTVASVAHVAPAVRPP